jgi:modification methylase
LNKPIAQTIEHSTLPLDTIIQGDCIEVLESMPAESVDLVFADPPYNLQLAQELWRPNLTLVDGVNDDWDRFSSFEAYDEFTRRWLMACRRILKPTGTLWVIGTYHNIFRVGATLQNLGFWILNDVIWEKINPMPNFRGVRFTNAHETLIWAQKEHGAPYTFNHHAMKALNDDLQMRSDWLLPICSGKERLKENGEKVHPTQKPEALLYRVILSSSDVGSIILDPFFGTGTTGVVAKQLHRHWIGIEKNPRYVQAAEERIAATLQVEFDPPLFVTTDPRRRARIPFGALLENGLIHAGDKLYFNGKKEMCARILADGSLEYNGLIGSIHKIAREIRNTPANGWELWFYEDADDRRLHPIDDLRVVVRESSKITGE